LRAVEHWGIDVDRDYERDPIRQSSREEAVAAPYVEH
jgi:hypothetical protein